MKRTIETVDELRAAGWRIWPDESCDFVLFEEDDVIPLTSAAGVALRRAQRGRPVPPRMTVHKGVS
jgi:hypothetical protein